MNLSSQSVGNFKILFKKLISILSELSYSYPRSKGFRVPRLPPPQIRDSIGAGVESARNLADFRAKFGKMGKVEYASPDFAIADWSVARLGQILKRFYAKLISTLPRRKIGLVLLFVKRKSPFREGNWSEPLSGPHRKSRCSRKLD